MTRIEGGLLLVYVLTHLTIIADVLFTGGRPTAAIAATAALVFWAVEDAREHHKERSRVHT